MPACKILLCISLLCCVLLQNASSKCAETIYKGRGNLEHKNLTSVDGNSESCEWTFQVGAGQGVRLLLKGILLQSGGNTSGDHLEIGKLGFNETGLEKYKCFRLYRGPTCPRLKKRKRCLDKSINENLVVKYCTNYSRSAFNNGSAHQKFSIAYNFINCFKNEYPTSNTSTAIGKEIPSTSDHNRATTEAATLGTTYSQNPISSPPRVSTISVNKSVPVTTGFSSKIGHDSTIQLSSTRSTNLSEPDETGNHYDIWKNKIFVHSLSGFGGLVVFVIIVGLNWYRILKKRRRADVMALPALIANEIPNQVYFQTLSGRIRGSNFEFSDGSGFATLQTTLSRGQQSSIQQMTLSRPPYENVTLPRALGQNRDDVATFAEPIYSRIWM